ncbi:MAG: hypothetical protein MEP57_08550 [Microvirga sp.]|nr:hypothetical protein [Microvirga sp.]
MSRRETIAEQRIDAVLALISASPVEPERVVRTESLFEARRERRLCRLFADLRRARPARPVCEIEDLVWALWISHPIAEAEAQMALAIDAFADGRLRRAGELFDQLVREYPDWAEAWNKRATLAYVEGRDAQAVADIARTLALEPRHFGAIAGFGQICLRHGREGEAKAAFRAALAINPHMAGLRALLDELAARSAPLH